jgi:hypothetical protein
MVFYNIIVFSPKRAIPSPLYKPITQYVPDIPILPPEPIYMKKSVSNVKNNLFLALDDEVRRPLPSIHRALKARLFIER